MFSIQFALFRLQYLEFRKNNNHCRSASANGQSNQMKYFIICFIALSLVLSSVITIEYNCVGTEMFPKYYGSPFIYKQDSLASSLESFYSISGIVLNMIVWSVLLYFIHFLIQKVVTKINSKIVLYFYKSVIIILLFISALVVYMSFELKGNGFNESTNYWYFDLDQEAIDWGMQCHGKLRIG